MADLGARPVSLPSVVDHLLSPFSSLFSTARQMFGLARDTASSPKTHKALVALVLASLVLGASCALSIVAYAAFYASYVPEGSKGVEVFLQYGFSQPPFADFALPSAEDDFFAPDVEYDVTLELSVPPSPANVDLGNFMVLIDLRSASNETVLAASRPAIMAYSSPPIRLLSSAVSFLSPFSSPSPYLSPFTSSSKSKRRSPVRYHPSAQTLSIPLFSRALLNPSFPITRPLDRSLSMASKVTHGRVQVGRHDQASFWATGAAMGITGPVGSRCVGSSRGELQVFESWLRFDADFGGVRYLLVHHPLISFLLFTYLFFLGELISALLIWGLITYFRASSSRPPSPFFRDKPPLLATEDTGAEEGEEESEETEKGSASAEVGEDLSSQLRHRRHGVEARRRRLVEVDREERRERRRRERERDRRAGRRMGGVDESVRLLGRDREEEEEEQYRVERLAALSPGIPTGEDEGWEWEDEPTEAGEEEGARRSAFERARLASGASGGSRTAVSELERAREAEAERVRWAIAKQRERRESSGGPPSTVGGSETSGAATGPIGGGRGSFGPSVPSTATTSSSSSSATAPSSSTPSFTSPPAGHIPRGLQPRIASIPEVDEPSSSASGSPSLLPEEPRGEEQDRFAPEEATEGETERIEERTGRTASEGEEASPSSSAEEEGEAGALRESGTTTDTTGAETEEADA